MNKILIISLMLVVSCASRPKLYPNEKFKSVGEKVADKDIDHCVTEADAYVKNSKAKQVGKSAGWGAAVGGTIGAVGGAFTGNVGRGLVRGGAMGAAGGGAAGAVSPDQMKRNFVNQCLGDKGYRVLGWD